MHRHARPSEVRDGAAQLHDRFLGPLSHGLDARQQHPGEAVCFVGAFASFEGRCPGCGGERSNDAERITPPTYGTITRSNPSNWNSLLLSPTRNVSQVQTSCPAWETTMLLQSCAAWPESVRSPQ